MKFSITDFFSKCDQICRKLRIWSHLLKKSMMGNFIFCAVAFKQLGYYCALAAMHSCTLHALKFTAFLLSDGCCHQISELLTMVHTWFQACIYWKIICYLTTPIAGIHLFLWYCHSTWSNPFCQGYCVCFTTRIEAFHYLKRTVVDSKNMKGNVFIGGKEFQPCYFEGACFFQRTGCSICSHSFFHGKCVTLTI